MPCVLSCSELFCLMDCIISSMSEFVGLVRSDLIVLLISLSTLVLTKYNVCLSCFPFRISFAIQASFAVYRFAERSKIKSYSANLTCRTYFAFSECVKVLNPGRSHISTFGWFGKQYCLQSIVVSLTPTGAASGSSAFRPLIELIKVDFPTPDSPATASLTFSFRHALTSVISFCRIPGIPRCFSSFAYSVSSSNDI